MKLSKNKVVALALAVCMIAILSIGSLAWFTAEDKVTNNFYVAGSEDLDPDEVFSVDVWEDDDLLDDPEGEEKIQDGIEYDEILPGDELFKEVHIENTGAYPQYIRATVTVTEAAIWQDVYGKRIVPLDVITNADLSGVHTQFAYYDAANDAFVYELYYTDILAVDKDFVVFDTVNISEDLDRYQAAAMQNFQINVVATAVQTENVGTNVYEAFETVGLVKTALISDPAELATALYAEGEARIVLDPSKEWNITVDGAMSDKTIDFAGANGTINFASGSSAENVVITGIVSAGGEGYTVETAQGFTGDLLIANCDFVDQSGGKFSAVRPTAGNVTIDNCTFTGTGDKDTYGVRTDHRSGNLTIKNSTFTNLNSWAILVNGKNDGDLTVDNCTFDTRDGVLKTLSDGVIGDFTFTNNTMIDCKGHDGNIHKLMVSGTGTDPVKATGTITYANNTYLGKTEGDVPMGGELVTAPIVGDSEGEDYEGELFEPGATDFLVAQNQSLIGNANITVERTYNTVVLENVIANVKGNLITAEADNTIILHNCDITLEEGAKLIVAANGATVGQVMIHNVTVNGQLLTQATAAQYLEGVNWYEVW